MDFNNKNKSFEELIRDKVEHHEFPFEAGNWAQMQSKLQAHQAQAAATKTTLYKSIFLKTGKVIVGIISGSAIIYSTLSLTGMLDKKDIAANQNQPQQQEIVLQQDEIKSPSAHTNSANAAAINIADEMAIAKANASAAKTQNAGFDAKNNLAGNNFTPANSSLQQSDVNAKHFSGNGNMQQALQNNVVDANKLANATVAKDAAVIDNSTQANKLQTNLSANNNASATVANANKLQNHADITSPKAENAYIATAENALAKTATDNNKTVTEKPAEKDETLLAATENETENKAGAALDSAMAQANVNGSKYPEKPSVIKPKSKVGLIVSAGTNVSWSGSKEGNSTTLDIVPAPMFGLHAIIPVQDRVAIQAGAQYASYDVKNVSHESALVQYSMVQSTTITRTTITECRYVEVPVLVKFAPVSKWNVYTGLRTNLLIGAKSNAVTEQYINGRQVGTPTPVEDAPEIARYNGLRTVNFAIPFGVEFVAGKRFSFSASYNLGLTDFTINKVFDNDRVAGQKDKHSSVQLQLNYKLF